MVCAVVKREQHVASTKRPQVNPVLFPEGLETPKNGPKSLHRGWKEAQGTNEEHYSA